MTAVIIAGIGWFAAGWFTATSPADSTGSGRLGDSIRGCLIWGSAYLFLLVLLKFIPRVSASLGLNGLTIWAFCFGATGFWGGFCTDIFLDNHGCYSNAFVAGGATAAAFAVGFGGTVVTATMLTQLALVVRPMWFPLWVVHFLAWGFCGAAAGFFAANAALARTKRV